MIKIERALISVFDKTKIEGPVRVLYREGIEILSTGGSAEFIKKLGIPVSDVSSYTEFPEILDGRVKTLHPRIFGGILFKRKNRAHIRTLAKHTIKPINLIIVNLYPFEKVISKKEVTIEEAFENIDIGGVALLRAAAKNPSSVVVLSDASQYGSFINEFNQYDGRIREEFALELSALAFSKCSCYDAIISGYIHEIIQETKTEKPDMVATPETIFRKLFKQETLRYGENPHQNAALYRKATGQKNYPRKLHGKQLSYNNLVDIDGTFQLISEFRDTKLKCAALIKHTNPCGIALSGSLSDAYARARECDPISFFGGIVGLSDECDEMTAKLISESFLEAVIAPSFSPTAMAILTKKKDLRLIEFSLDNRDSHIIMRDTIFGTVVQDDDPIREREELEKKTNLPDDNVDMETLQFAIKVCKHVKSNAIVLARGLSTVGIGAGQMSRIDALKVAIEKAGGRTSDAVMASDAFFPFPDCVELAHRKGISAIVQPGGSRKDEESIKEAEKWGIPLYFTGIRHFKHQ